MERILWFSKIYVAESLSDGEWRTGRNLYKDVLQLAPTYDAGLNASFDRVSTKKEFIAFLEKVLHEVNTSDMRPIIHLEMHGYQDGLRLYSGEEVQWHEVCDYLVRINIGCRNNLLITVAACEGAHLFKLINQTITARAPFWGLIGPERKVTDKEVALAFHEFYSELLHSFDGTKARKRMGDDFKLITCELLFRTIWNKYLDTQFTANIRQERVERVITKIRKTPEGRSRSLGDMRRFVKNGLKKENFPFFFEKYKSRFFMIDLYPENAERFPVKSSEFV